MTRAIRPLLSYITTLLASDSDTMKAWKLPAFNEDPAEAIKSLTLEEVPIPSPLEPDQVLLKVNYASVNPIDWKLFTGGYQSMFPIASFPYTPGFDVAGVVKESTSSSFSKGDTLIADLGLAESCTDPAPKPGGPAGAFAQYCVVPASLCVKVKDLHAAAGLPLAGMTSYQALFTGGGASLAGEPLGDSKAGSKVLILGASGGTGILAVQMAKSAGCTVAATASSTPMPGDSSQTKVDFVTSMGADTVIDYKTQDWAEVLKGQDYDLIYDCVGSLEDLTVKAPQVLKKGGTFASIANFDPSSKSTDDVRFANFIIKSNSKDLQAMVDMMDKGKLKVPIDSEFGFEEVPKALEKSLGGRSVGKILIKINL